MFQDEGASTAKTGISVVSRADTTERKGSRTSPVKLKPAYVSPGEKIKDYNWTTKDCIYYVVCCL